MIIHKYDVTTMEELQDEKIKREIQILNKMRM